MGADTVPCQCGREGCDARVPAGGRAHAAHQNPNLRVVAPGHAENGDVLVLERDDHWVVRRLDPVDTAEDPAAASFPASDPPSGPGAV